jgi:hypothetical protein
MLRRLSETWRVVRPRAAAETRVAVRQLERGLAAARDDVKELRQQATQHAEQQRRGFDALGAQLADVRAALSTQLTALTAELQALRGEHDRLQRREAQLRAVLQREAVLEAEEAGLAAALRTDGLHAHVQAAVAAAPMRTVPCPYIVIDNVLPPALYQAIITGLPPSEIFNEQPHNKAQARVPFALAPAYSRRVWRHMVDTVVPEVLRPVLIERFRDVLDAWVRQSFPGLDDAGRRALEYVASDGRLLMRTRGYRIPPHRDPRWGFLTGILYLAKPDDDQRWGTQFYTVEGDVGAASALPHWIRDDQCRLVEDILFTPNRLIVFLNSTGAHGASIPEDAEPATLERYIYQFRIGPPADWIRRLVETLPEHERAAWRGKVGDY